MKNEKLLNKFDDLFAYRYVLGIYFAAFVFITIKKKRKTTRKISLKLIKEFILHSMEMKL